MASLANYNFTVKQRSGKNNADSDELSSIEPNTINPVNTVESAPVKCTPLCFAYVSPESLLQVTPAVPEQCTN